MNTGLEEVFYVPLAYHQQWYRAIHEAGLDIFLIRTLGVPNAVPKNSSHFTVEAELKCRELGLEPRKNLLEEYYKESR